MQVKLKPFLQEKLCLAVSARETLSSHSTGEFCQATLQESFVGATSTREVLSAQVVSPIFKGSLIGPILPNLIKLWF